MTALRLDNPMRYLVPVGTALGAIVMFIAPVVVAGVNDRKVAIGAAVLLLCVLWLLRSAWRAPYAMILDVAGARVLRWSGERQYAFTQFRKWWFAIPDGPPTKVPPPDNGILYAVLDDGTRFRAEVTADQATHVVSLLPAG